MAPMVAACLTRATAQKRAGGAEHNEPFIVTDDDFAISADIDQALISGLSPCRKPGPRRRYRHRHNWQCWRNFKNPFGFISIPISANNLG